MIAPQKDGASIPARPAVSLPFQGSHWVSGQDSARAKVRALFDVMGGKPMIVRFSDDRTAILSAEALRVIDIPLSHGA